MPLRFSLKISNAFGEIDNKILLVRHTYGTAKDRILLPGGYVKEKELPTTAIEREIFEETGVSCKSKELYSMQFKSEQWCAVFTLDYVSGKPQSDGNENSEVLLLTTEEALAREDLTNMSREILKSYKENKNGLKKSDYISKKIFTILKILLSVLYSEVEDHREKYCGRRKENIYVRK